MLALTTNCDLYFASLLYFGLEQTIRKCRYRERQSIKTFKRHLHALIMDNARNLFISHSDLHF